MPCTFLWVALGIGMAAASVALVSYYAFERPILRFKDHRRRSPAASTRGADRVASL